MDKPLIAGIDPGTTTAVILLDPQGHIVYRKSKKQMGMAELLSSTYSYGKILAVGTDKTKIPGFVKQYSKSIGAKTIHPPADLTSEEKREMNRARRFENAHEADAHASAILALNHIRPLLKRIEQFLNERGETYLLAELTAHVMSTNTNIQQAYYNISHVPEEPASRNTAKPPSNTERISQRANQYKNQVRIMHNTITALREQVKHLEEQNRRLNHRVKKLKPKNKKKETEIVSTLYQRLDNHDQRIATLEHERKALAEHLYTLNDSLIVQHVPNLAKRIIPKSQYLYVDTPNEISLETIDSLQHKNITILCSKEPRTHIFRALHNRGIDIITNVPINHTHGISHVRRKDIDKSRESKERILRIIKEHQERFNESH